jgi:hypothetical protein
MRVRICSEYPGYVISDDGRIQGPGRWHPGWLKPGLSGSGYLHVGIERNGRYLSTSVHVIVCTAFHGPAPTSAHEVAHNDGDRFNNHASNLRWDTHPGNHADKIQHGTSLRGTGHNMVKLTEDQVREIRGLFGALTESKIAERYGVSRGAVNDIRRGRNWGWLV